MSFLEDFEKTLKEKCYQDDPPYCQAACPFFLDVKALEDKWKKGRFNAAYRTYQTAVAFPAIVSEICPHPCEKACIRSGIDGPVALSLLEKATLDFAKRKTPNNFNMPSRGKRAAVVGGGLSGLGCALRLSNNKYEVTVFEKADIPGGEGRKQMDPEAFDAEIRNQFQFEKTVFRLGEEVTSLEEIRDSFDAVYVATGKGGETFGMVPSGTGAFASEVPGVFLGGGLLGRNPVEALADGIRAAVAIEKYLQTGLMNEPKRKQETRIRMKTDKIPPAEPVRPASGERFTEQEAVEEISRCLRCSCDYCMKACDILRLKAKTPKRIYEEVYITIRPGTLSRDGTWATRLISTCNQCGLCREVCPQHIDLGEFFADAMRAMQEKGAMPWAFHDFWLRDMAFSSGEAKICRKPDENGKSSLAFFTGCQLGASDPRYVTESYRWLRKHFPDTALWMTCCGAPAAWAGDTGLHESYLEKLRAEWDALGKPKVVFACPSCRKLFDRYLPEIPGVFLTELMAEASDAIRTGPAPEQYHLFDPCAGREHPELQESVRKLLSKEGIPYEEPEYSGRESRCCGYGGHIGIAAPNFTGVVQKERSEESELPYVTYCVNCREAFAGKGHDALHILDLLFGLNGPDREMLTVSRRRENRRSAKRAALREFWGEELPMENHIDLEISGELERKLSLRQVLNEDMVRVVEYLEKEQRGVLDVENGTITGHLKTGNMTYWAEYRKKPEGGFVLVNGYAHRMNLEGE